MTFVPWVIIQSLLTVNILEKSFIFFSFLSSFQNSFFFFTQMLLFLVKNIRSFKTFLGTVFLIYLLLLLLSRFSRVRLCVTPQTAAHQAPPSLGFSRQEPWSGLPFPSPLHESKVSQSCPTLSDPMDCSPSGSSVHAIFSARVPRWAAIDFSRYTS